VVGAGRGYDAVALLGALGLLGCGGESEGGGCGPFSACGGDPIGVWQSQGVCVEQGFASVIDSQDLPAECRNTMHVGTPRPDTLLTIESDGTYTTSGTVILPWRMSWDVACVSALAGQPIGSAEMPAFCDSFRSQSLDDPDSPFASMNCQVVVDVCMCDATQLVIVSGGGTYQVQGTTFVFSDGATNEFCVQGDELVLRSEDPMFGGALATYIRATP
jgi:hypothetical protein